MNNKKIADAHHSIRQKHAGMKHTIVLQEKQFKHNNMHNKRNNTVHEYISLYNAGRLRRLHH